MHKTIWKFELTAESEQTIKAPSLWKPLTVQMQRGNPVLWAEVNPDLPLDTYKLYIFGTGWTLPTNSGRYIATFQLPNGLVFHVYEAETF